MKNIVECLKINEGVISGDLLKKVETIKEVLGAEKAFDELVQALDNNDLKYAIEGIWTDYNLDEE